MLKEEKDADDALKAQFKERWNRTPSEKLTEMFRTNEAKYRQIINSAVQVYKDDICIILMGLSIQN